MELFSKTNVMIKILLCFESKTPFFGENNLIIITSVQDNGIDVP
jgi:hypothetical protein